MISPILNIRQQFCHSCSKCYIKFYFIIQQLNGTPYQINKSYRVQANLIHIKIGRVQFFFQKQHLFYYDQQNQILKFNIDDIEIQIENPFCTKSKNINFQIVPTSKNDPQVNLEFTLRCYNRCYEILKKGTQSQLNYTIQQKPKLQLQNYFYGPIDHLKIIENDYFYIDGPHNQNPIGIQVTEIDIKSIFSFILHPRNILLKFSNQSILLFNSQDTHLMLGNDSEQNYHLENIILLNDYSILFLFFKDLQNGIRGVIYQIDQTTFSQNPIFEIQRDFNYHQKMCKSFKTGDIIIIKMEFTLVIYQIDGYNLTFINNNLNIIEILKIKDNNQLYISLSTSRPFILSFQILLLDNFQFQVKGTTSISWNTIYEELINHILIHQGEYNDSQFIFLECIIENEKLNIIILQIFSQYSVISQILMIFQNLEISYMPSKILRNPVETSFIEFKFYSQQNLILKSQSGSTYFYDLREDLKLYDYNGKQTQLQQAYHAFNIYRHFYYQLIQSIQTVNINEQLFYDDLTVLKSFHFIILQMSNANMLIKLYLQERLAIKLQQLKIAENIVQCEESIIIISQQELKVQLTMFEIGDQIQDDKTHVLLLLLIFLLLVVLYFLIRRKQLKSKSINNQQQGSSQLNNSEL